MNFFQRQPKPVQKRDKPLPPGSKGANHPIKNLPPSPEKRDTSIVSKKGLDNPTEWHFEWFEKVGFTLYEESLNAGFTTLGALLIIGHAYLENATTVHGRSNGYAHHNWWNYGALKSRKQSKKEGYRFASFNNLHDGIIGYFDRITSTSDLIEYKNENFNPSFPDFGKLLKLATKPTAQQINTSLRIGGQFVFCNNRPTYGTELLSVSKTSTKHFISYLDYKIEYQSKTVYNSKKEGEDEHRMKDVRKWYKFTNCKKEIEAVYEIL